mmetsp:Transcript_401/g.379  ORF Transcript_401/g.379 Transcript_401/m.379 type:complete len:80 (-) Transcript_401:1369-1608(-)
MSDSCTSSYCNDIWRYEIPYAPESYYTTYTSESYWRRGNYWEELNPSSNPGRRAWYSMTTDDQGSIYIFGGVVTSNSGV